MGDGDRQGGSEVVVRSSTPDIRQATLQAALDYAALGWPVVPGAIWRGGRFADPVDGAPVLSPYLRPLPDATTDADLVRRWWSAPGRFVPNILTPVSANLGVFTVFATLAEAVARHPWFGADPTPVLAIQGMPLTYFLVRPPMPAVLLSDHASVVDRGMPLPLPPTSVGGTEVLWLITPEEAGNTLVTGDDLADLIHHVERKTA